MTTADMSVPLPDEPDSEQGYAQNMGDEQQQGMPAAAESQPNARDAADGVGDDGPVPLLAADELQTVVSKWREIQAEFVDQPRRAMQEADTLVSDLMERLSRTFAQERDRLESRWSNDESVSTEDLRRGLQRYRSFFERLLAA